MSDQYQQRYEAHQQRKKEVLIEIISERHSNRRFSDEKVEGGLIHELRSTVDACPNSCNRHAISTTLVTHRDEKALLGGILVGGVGWIHRAPYILLLFADQVAYKAPGEIEYMPYLDAGVVVQQLSLFATAAGLHCAYANPNIRDMNKPHFEEMFGDKLFCGAFAFGHPLE